MSSRPSRFATAVLGPPRPPRRAVRAAAAATTALGCLLVAAGTVGLAAGPGLERWAGQSAPELRLVASDATWVYASGAPAAPDESDGTLRAGDTAGGAVTYLKFDVPYQPQTLARGVLQLTGAEQPLPSLVELVAVPDTGWQPETLSWDSAPLFGTAVQSVRPALGDQRVEFDVTGLVDRPGVYAFAVTVPPDRGHAAFVGAGAGDGEPVLRLRWAAPTAVPSLGPALSGVPEDAVAPPVPPAGSAPPAPPAPPTATATAPATAPPTATGAPEPSAPPAPADPPECAVQDLLVPSCGVLWGVAPDGHTGSPRTSALTRFEEVTGRRQDIYHAYHRAQSLFPTAEEVAIAREGRILFLNWKPLNWSWAQIAGGHPTVDSYLDRLAEHIQVTYPDPFFFTVHHEPENNVRQRSGSGWETTDYAAMYRYVVQRLRAAGVDNLVTVMNYMAYVPWNAQPWFPELYPGDDVVDWIAWNAYAYSDPGYGYGDFGELMNRRSSQYPAWPGFYTWATMQFPHKPFMLGEWGVWHSLSNPGHMAHFYESVARQTPLFPRVKAMVYFDTPGDQRGRDSRPTVTESGLTAYRRLGDQPYFQVQLAPGAASYGR